MWRLENNFLWAKTVVSGIANVCYFNYAYSGEAIGRALDFPASFFRAPPLDPLALEAAKYGITVNNVAPGYLDTYMMRDAPQRIREKILDKSPVRRFGLPEEVAHAVMFLIDDKAAWTTGSTVTMNGGTHMY